MRATALNGRVARVCSPTTDGRHLSIQETPGSTASEQLDARSPLSELSNAMVRIYKQQFGRGPTKVRSDFAGPNTVVCLLENTFTPAEKNLQAMGEHQRLRDTRMFPVRGRRGVHAGCRGDS